jgi:cellulose synthase/poly-beta-1,6-N-acetylglucosamine synthase-like glycosyltransferase
MKKPRHRTMHFLCQGKDSMPASHLLKTPDPGSTGTFLIASLMGAGLSTPAAAQELAATWQQRPASLALALMLSVIVLIMLSYGLRQMLYALNRVFGTQRYPYAQVVPAQWPMVTVFIAAHNEEKVIADSMQALLQSDYPPERLKVVVVNDRSSDRTAAIVNATIAQHPGRLQAFHRSNGKPGKAAALKDAVRYAQGDIVLIFDADYTPAPGLLRQLVTPFLDPEVGAVMGRVVPRNVSTNLLTRMLDMERSAGYQVDQQARMNLHGVPQFGGTVGGVRLSAVQAAGGWRDDVLAEDTDITFRLLVAGWKTVYNNQATCYEEVPEEWSVRLRQIHRWAKGHNQVLWRQVRQLIRSPWLSWRERIDGLMLLHIFLLQPLLLLGWVMALGLYYLNGSEVLTVFIPGLLLVVYAAVGGFSAFMQMVYAVLVDGHRQRIRLLPLQMFNFVASLPTITAALGDVVLDRVLHKELVWHKTVRYRKESGA